MWNHTPECELRFNWFFYVKACIGNVCVVCTQRTVIRMRMNVIFVEQLELVIVCTWPKNYKQLSL